MAKIKYRFRDEILGYLKTHTRPLPLHIMLRDLFSKDELRGGKLEQVVNAELRHLVKDKLVDRLPGSLYRLRPPKAVRVPAAPGGPQNKKDRGRPNKLQELRPRGSGAPGALVGKVVKNPKGFAFVVIENPPPALKEDVFLNPEEAQDLMTGDRVEIRLDTRKNEKGASGRLLRIVERGVTKIVARYEAGKGPRGPSAESVSRDMQMIISLPRDPAYRTLPTGAAVMVEILEAPKGGEPARGKILSVLADSLDSTTDDPFILTKHKLRFEFPLEVIRESEKFPERIGQEDMSGRTDLRKLPFVTIDGRDARDFDDAVAAERLPDGSIRLWVAIADVAHYVQPGSPLDQEAYLRGTSVYFPHRVLPMLPERLSNGLCSLNPHEDRLCMVAEIDFNRDGKKIRQRVYNGVFQSQHRCVYEDLQKYFDAPAAESATYNPGVRTSLDALFELYKRLRRVRIERGSIDLDLPEAKVKVGPDGTVLTIMRVDRLDTHRLIEEFMIAANEAVSEIMQENHLPFVYRVHEPPEPDAVKRFLDTARALGIPLKEPKGGEHLDPKTYQSWAEIIQQNPAARVLHFQMLRSMKQAYYTDENLMHFGLASAAYSHFTSPIRRYPDLMVHRLLKAFLSKNQSAFRTAQGGTAESLAEACQHCSQRERIATDAEREMVRMKQVRYAEKHVGEIFAGSVVGVTAKGLFVELQAIFLEGFVPLERLGFGFEYNEKSMTVRERRSGRQYRLGDPIEVQIARTNPHLLQIELEPVKGTKQKGDA